MSRMMAIYGGAFDPFHDGHLAVAIAARDALSAEIALMPTGDPRHRTSARATADQRIAMLNLAIAGLPHLSVDAREIYRQGASYTFDTLSELRAELGERQPLAMIVGQDAFAGFPTWHRWREIFDLAHVVVATRPPPVDMPDDLIAVLAERQVNTVQALHCQPAGTIWVMSIPPHPASSSEIRRRCEKGLAFDEWLSPAVAEFIVEQGLYGYACSEPTQGV